MDEILKWNKDFKLENGVLKLYLDQYSIELVVTDKDEGTEFDGTMSELEVVS